MLSRRIIAMAAIVATCVASFVTASTAATAAPRTVARAVPNWDPSSIRERTAALDPVMADSLQRVGVALPEVTWSPLTVTDPLDDQGPNSGEGQSDITGMRLASTTETGVPSLFASVTVRNFAPPWDQNWVDYPSYVGWVIDRNNDNRGDFVVEYADFDGLLFGDVYNLNVLDAIGNPAHVCNAIPVYTGAYFKPGSYGVYVPWSCLGNPSSVKVFARMNFLQSGFPSIDEVPNTTWASVASRILPNTPSTPSTTSAPASLDVAWSAPATSLWPVTDYVVQFSPSYPIAWKTFADGVSATRTARVTGLTPGKKYLVRVASKNKLRTSAFSPPSVARAALAAGVVPSAPGRPKGVSGAGRVTLSWTAPTKVGSRPINDYQIEYSANAGKAWVRLNDAVTTTRSAVITGLTPASRITARVRARSFAGVGAWSAVSLMLAPFTTPSAPRSLTGIPGNKSANLSWLPPSTVGGGTIDRYRVYYRPVATAPALLPPVQIVNGGETTIAAAPWQVRVRLDLGGGSFGLCGGSLVDPQWVLTAAHCVKGRSASSLLVHGGLTRQNEMNAFNGVTIDKVLIHSQYLDATHVNDIALLHLTKATKGTPIKLYGDPAGPVATTSAKVTGWGVQQYNSGVQADVLRAATVQVQASPGDPCGSYGTVYVPTAMLCANAISFGAGVDTCQGDSGGPLVVVDGRGTPRLAGVTSFGNGCGNLLYPGIYTRVSSYIRWIQDRVESTWPYVDVMCTAPCLARTMTGLTNDTTYQVMIRARTQYGFGAFTAPILVTPTSQVPGTPTEVLATAIGTDISVAWTVPTDDGGSAITGFQVTYDDGLTFLDAAAGPALVPGLDPLQSFTFKVRAINIKGPGPWSNASNAVSPQTPA